ncbi:MAG TPA: nuclear transport factor 2 family protein [Anaerolineae bacterium]|nr:nuclear transport factor 2 family protein [Anaerolineae bacterium]
MNAIDNKQAVLRCVELFNKCTMEWLDTCYADHLEWTELPWRSFPQGRHGDLSTYRQSVEQALRLYPDRQLRVLRSVAEGNCVVLEQEWQGTAAFTVGGLVAGTVSKLRIVSFFTLENGLITKQTDYCTGAA